MLLLSLWGCDGFYQAPPNTGAGPGPAQTAGAPAQTAGAPAQTESANKPESEWGVVKCASRDESKIAFNKQIQFFFSTTERFGAVPYINCSGRKDLKGGMWIKGQAVFSDEKAALDLSSLNQNLDISDRSFLEIHVVDTAGKAWPITMRGLPHASKLDGKYAVLTFADKKGEVILDGQIEKRLFKGAFKFENFTTYEGHSPGYEGQIGNFSIPACSLFKCQSASPSSGE